MRYDNRDADSESVIFRGRAKASEKSSEHVVRDLRADGNALREEQRQHHPEEQRRIAREKMVVFDETGAGREEQSGDAGREQSKGLAADGEAERNRSQEHDDDKEPRRE